VSDARGKRSHGHAAYRRIVGRGLVGGVPSAALDRPGPWWCARV